MECGFRYTVFVGYDAGDAFFDSPVGVDTLTTWFQRYVRNPLQKEGIDVDLVPVRVDNPSSKPGPVFNAVALQAQSAAVDFFYRINDDTLMVTPWAGAFACFCTGHLLREVASTGRIDLPAFYARRARRLLPAATLTLVAVGVAAFLWMPAFTWKTVAADMVASTLYAENWVLVRRSVDYHAQGETPSPLQHFWSLAVEEQFYVGWPLLVAGVAACWRKRRSNEDNKSANPGLLLQPPPRRAYAPPMGIAVCGLSFAAAVHYVRTNPAAGYFMTHVRLFELGLGGLLGVWAVGTPAWPHEIRAARRVNSAPAPYSPVSGCEKTGRGRCRPQSWTPGRPSAAWISKPPSSRR